MKTKLGIVLVIFLFFNSIKGQNFSRFSNVEELFNLTKNEVENKIVNENGYRLKSKDKSGILTYTKKNSVYTFAVNLLFKGDKLKMIGWDDTLMSGKYIVEDIGNDSCYKIDEKKTNDYLGIFTTVCKDKGFQVLISKTIPNLNKGMMGFTLKKINNNIPKQNGATILKQKNINTNENIDYNFVKDSIVIDKREILTKMFPNSSFENDSTIVRKQFVKYMDGGDGEIEYKTSVLKEYYYIDEKDDGERVNVILLNENKDKNVFLETLTYTILDSGKSYQNIKNRRLNIDSKKLNNSIYKTIKENGQTFFTIEYLDEDNSRKIDYYSPLDMNYLHTVVKEDEIQKETISNVVPKQNITTKTNLEFLKKYKGKYPYDVKLLNNPTLKKRIVDLIGVQKYNYMKNTWRVEGGIGVENNMFDASGCEQHNCGNTNFIIVVDLEKNILYIGYRVESEILKFGEDQNYPKLILDWEKENINGE